MPSPIEISIQKSLIVQKITEQKGLCPASGKPVDYKTCVVLMKDDRPYMVITRECFAAQPAANLAFFASREITFETERMHK